MVSQRITSPDLQGQFLLLGTGTSVGVPVIGCACATCRSPNPRNQRLRCAAVAGLPAGNLLIDTPPDLRLQLIRAQLGQIDAVAFTHEHADHLYGLDDLRIFQFYLGHPVPVYCEPVVEQRIRHVFDYAFSKLPPTHAGAVPQLDFHGIDTTPFRTLGAEVIPLRLQHGPRFQVLGFRFGNLAYCTDTNAIPDATWPLLEGLEFLILDALRPTPHPTHFSLPEAIGIAERIGAAHTFFTHVSHELEYEATHAGLPAGMALAYDGLQLPLDLSRCSIPVV